MDTGLDFIQPEFLNLLFFQQKSVVIFPYMDLKHLHSLEVFAIGYNIIDLESTALYNLREIIEFESNNSYSQNPSLLFIYNLDAKKIREIMKLKNIRCVLNTSENVSHLASGSGNDFIFYNKKSKEFVNFDVNALDLDFEKQLISSSANETILQDKIQKIKIVATRIFTEINEGNALDNLTEILADYDYKYWKKILLHVSRYYQVVVPEVKELAPLQKENITQSKKRFCTDAKDFFNEYEILVNFNKDIGKKFVQLLHGFCSKKVNQSNLEIEQLYYPQKLYNYLRNHHWKSGISEEFLVSWVQAIKSNGVLSKDNLADFETIFEKIKVSKEITIKIFDYPPSRLVPPKIKDKSSIKLANGKKNPIKSSVPSVKDFQSFKKWILKKIQDIDELCSN
ncbi:MAG: hypothetical protein ACTSUT_01270 [Promethearchaeota archaeon]